MASQQDMMRQALGKIMAVAWIDPEFKSRLFSDPRPILAEAGLLPPPQLELKIVENTIGMTYIALPAPWADTSNPVFMQRLQKNPRAVLSECGIEVSETAQIAFLENTNTRMYIVLPIAPDSSEISIEKM